jgi:hypothetical protein
MIGIGDWGPGNGNSQPLPPNPRSLIPVEDNYDLTSR